MSRPWPDAGERVRVRVTGAVQGVGFRPFVYRLAMRYALSGFVLNDEDGVLAEVEGSAVGAFLGALRRERPPLARIDGVAVTRLARQGAAAFAIRPTPSAGAGSARMAPDAATCQGCLADLFDPTSRFHLYPFVTCADCGPRFTVTAALPYDRANTAMAGFPLCPRCARDHADPADRRFHAETIACPDCGPKLSHGLDAVAKVLLAGGLVAIKGVGGFHLVCDARDEAAVASLRRRKRRPVRPLAVMTANVASAAIFARTTPETLALLAHSAAPVVLLAKGEGLAPSIAPGLGRVGMMLPGSPLQHLVFHALAGFPPGQEWRDAPLPFALVTTSANAAGRPMIIDNDEAADLADIADLVVTHDRPILTRADDSVMSVIDGAPAFLRRSRGFAPEPIDLGEDGPSVLAVGGHLKSAVCVTRGREAFLSAHLGDLDTAPTVRVYEAAARRLMADLGVRPVLVACDRHPDYRSTLFAESLGPPVLRVQHHAAHMAATAAEHGLGKGAMVGVALDGHGHGEDGGAWGGELMRRDDGAWRRIGRLWPLARPGGDRAARDPWRMGVAVLAALGRADEAAARFPEIGLAGPVAKMLAGERQGPTTTSLGRLFDAVAALLGICARQTYDGQAAMELEALVTTPRAADGGFVIEAGVLDFRPMLARLLMPGLSPGEGADLFHGVLIAGLAAWIDEAVDRRQGVHVVLGGGCLMNAVLAEGLAGALRERGLDPRLPRLVPANDGGLCLGQAALARAHLARAHLAGTPRAAAQMAY